MQARWRLWNPILGAQTLLRFGLAKVLAEDDWKAARTFCPLRRSFAALLRRLPDTPHLLSHSSHDLKLICVKSKWKKYGLFCVVYETISA